jgi:hypothetical protein
MRQKSMQELWLTWISFVEEAHSLNSKTLEVLASEAFNSLIICIQSECEKYGIDYSIENLCGDNTYRMTIMNRINEKYMEEEENKLKQEMYEREIDRAEARYDAIRKGE